MSEGRGKNPDLSFVNSALNWCQTQMLTIMLINCVSGEDSDYDFIKFP